MEGGSTEIGRQRSEKRRAKQVRDAPGRPVEEAGRPACTGAHRMERSTGPGRPTEVASLSGWRGRPGRSTVALVGRPAGQPTDRLEFPFRIRIPFLIGIESNLGFHKLKNFVAINRG